MRSVFQNFPLTFCGLAMVQTSEKRLLILILFFLLLRRFHNICTIAKPLLAVRFSLDNVGNNLYFCRIISPTTSNSFHLLDVVGIFIV